MKIVDKLLRKAGYVKRGRKHRGYAAANVGRLFNDWIFSSQSTDTKLKADLKKLVARSRDLCDNDDYAKKYVKAVATNVVGAGGIIMQSKIKDSNGNLDAMANNLLESNFKEWGKKENASVDWKLSWIDIQRIAMSTTVRDGESFVRIVRGFDNPFRFSLQMIEPDHIDINLNKKGPGENEIRMGIEYNEWKRPVAYHVKVKNPADDGYAGGYQKTQRVLAKDMVHLFFQESSEQGRGIPWMHTAMKRLKMLNGYEEAELVASRVAACKMGFYTSETGEDYKGDDIDDKGNIISEAEPGVMEQLPTGVNVTTFDPQHPTGNYAPYVKQLLRGTASGFQMSYNSLASDLESVNYSSIRAGTLEERDMWRIIQGVMASHFCASIYEAWLDMVLMIQKVPLPYAKYEKFNSPKWQPRGWDWVDPEKDMKANIRAIKAGLKTWSQVAAERGLDVEELFAQLKADKELAEKYGLVFKLD